MDTVIQVLKDQPFYVLLIFVGGWLLVSGFAGSLLIPKNPYPMPQKIQRVGIGLVGLIAVGFGLSVYINQINSVSASPDVLYWDLSFSHKYPPNTWSTGTHKYTLRISCPGTDTNSTTNTFEVSPNSQPKPSHVYLGTDGVQDSHGISLSVIDPGWETTASWRFLRRPKTNVDFIKDKCHITIKVDDDDVLVLDPGEPDANLT